MQVGLRLWVQIINGQPRITSEQVPWRTEREYCELARRQIWFSSKPSGQSQNSPVLAPLDGFDGPLQSRAASCPLPAGTGLAC